MPRKSVPLENWVLEAIQLIVRRQLSLRQAAQQLGVQISVAQADNIQGRIRFQNELEQERLAYYAGVGNNPSLTRDAVAGQLFVLAQTLAEMGEHFKSAETLLKLAKVQGWTSAEEQKDKPVLGNLTQEDLNRIRAEYEAKQDQQDGEQQTAPEQTTEAASATIPKAKVN